MLDLNKPFRTKCGFKARLLCSNLEGTSSRIVVGVFIPFMQREVVIQYSRNGERLFKEKNGYEEIASAAEAYGPMYDYTLVNAPVRRSKTIWVNLYPDATAAAHESLEEADKAANSNRVACREITYEWEEKQ